MAVPRKLLIDEILPHYEVVERHRIDITAPAEEVYAAARLLDLGGSRVIRWLLRLRGFPPRCLTLEALQKTGFTILADDPHREIVLGLVGRFWKLSGDIQPVRIEDFMAFNRPGYCKAAWNFFLDPASEKITRLSTETRVNCTDKGSLRKFQIYWAFIRPFSGLIRKEILRTIKRTVE